MRSELELIEKIEQYLKDELSNTDKADFEKQMADNPALREEVRLQQEVMNGIERAGLKQKIQIAKRNFRQGKNFTKWGLGGLSILVVLTAAFLFYKNNTVHHTYEGKSLPKYNENGEKQWADADKNISAQTFIIDASKDTVIETKGGIVMAVPANGFLDENGNSAKGNVELVVKEALDPATMMNAGLSTKSGGDLLESGGMFFIDARKDGKPLKINPANGIYTEVPANDIKPGMQLFSGKRMPDGTIDWVDPKPLEHDLMPVDIQSLNFYPPHYLDSLQRWGYDIKNKEFMDSLYYSFARLFWHPTPATADSTTAVRIENNKIVSAPKEERIFESLKKDPSIQNIVDDFQTDTGKYLPDTLYYDIPCGINPAKIKAIWNDKFQNTILATREFEERLHWIHIIGDPAILDLYVNNLDKSLSFIDSLAASRWHAGNEAYNIFLSFASRHDGKVKNGSARFQELKSYYENKSKAFTEAIAKTQNEFWNKQAQSDNDADNRKSEHETDSANRMQQNFAEEFNLNLKEAYRQLGYDTSIKPGGNRNVYKVDVTSTGWCNVDRYVYASTVNRTTLNYTDTGTGKKAVINYLPFSIQVDQWNEYDQLYVYLLPDKLNSFMRLDGGNGKYSEKLDELIKYDLVCIAYKGEQAYYYSEKVIQSKEYTGIKLSTISKDELILKLNSAGGLAQVSDIQKENDFFQFEVVDKKRQKHNMALQELTDKIRELIFPCYGERPVASK
jgi:hypothetical protein